MGQQVPASGQEFGVLGAGCLDYSKALLELRGAGLGFCLGSHACPAPTAPRAAKH